METSSMKKYAAEAFGTFVLTLFGCGSAAVAGATLGTLGIAMAFGLSIVAMAFVIGNVSGCHINPAVSFGLFLDKRLSGKDLAGYWVAQFVGGIVAAAVLALVISMCDLGGVAATGLGCDGYGAASAVGISLVGALIVEVILTCIFVLSVLGSTADERTAPYAGIIIGLTLAFVHIMGIPLTGTSVNPARSFGPALMMAVSGDATALSQVWVFIAAPLAGAALAALIWMGLKKRKYRRRQQAGKLPFHRGGRGAFLAKGAVFSGALLQEREPAVSQAQLLHHGPHHGTAALEADEADGHGHGIFRCQHAHRQGGIGAAERRNARREDDAALAKEPDNVR